MTAAALAAGQQVAPALRIVSATPVAPVVATIVFTDIVGSTRRAQSLGDEQWYAVLQRHHAVSRSTVAANGGRFLRTVGDGVLATFDVPSRAIQCMLDLRDALADVDIPIRVGIHAGEVMSGDNDVSGLAVAIAARLVRLAPAGGVVVSRTVADLAVGSGLEFSRPRMRRLKGVRGTWTTLKVLD